MGPMGFEPITSDLKGQSSAFELGTRRSNYTLAIKGGPTRTWTWDRMGMSSLNPKDPISWRTDLLGVSLWIKHCLRKRLIKACQLASSLATLTSLLPQYVIGSKSTGSKLVIFRLHTDIKTLLPTLMKIQIYGGAPSANNLRPERSSTLGVIDPTISLAGVRIAPSKHL